MPKKKEKTKVNIEKKKINTKPNKKSKEDNYRNIESINYIIKKIEPDGNCFYRAISYFYRDTEEDYTEFREIITSYIEENMGLYIEYIADEDVDIPKEKENNDEFKQNKKLEYMKNYIKEAKKMEHMQETLKLVLQQYYLDVI